MKGSKKRMKKKSVKAQTFQFQFFVVMLLKAQEKKKHGNGIRGRKFVDGACAVYRLRQFQ